MIVSRKLLKAIAELCWSDQERYREMHDFYEGKVSFKVGLDETDDNSIFTITSRVIREMHEIGIDEKRIRVYMQKGFAAILYYCAAKSITNYSEREISEFISAMHTYCENGNFSADLFNKLRKAASIIASYHQKGYLIRGDITRGTNRRLSEGFEGLIDLYKMKIHEHKSFSESTIASGCVAIRIFLYHLEQRGINDIRQFSFKEINDVITIVSEHYGGGLASTLHGIKAFLNFLFEEKMTSDNFSITVPKPAKTSVIRDGFTDEEILKILNAVNRNTRKGKRDYAILLIAAKLGLRTVDIVNLKLQDICWRSNEVTIVQQKTGVSLKLPLPPDVGNAIAAYILNARPEGRSDKVFFNYTIYHRELQRSSIVPMIRKYMKLSGVDDSEIPLRGMHSFRRSFGKRLLEHGADIDMINELLGHNEMNSSKPYLAIDESGLKKCGLGLIDLGLEVAI